jgi:diguanylate cyclase (GGDEF)-like protein
MERIRLDISSAPVTYDSIQIPITASFGIVHISPAQTLDDMITLADTALYRAKESGRNRVVFYGEDV